MPSNLFRSQRTLLAIAFAIAGLLALPAVGLTKPVLAELRVEGPEKTLDFGTSYVTDTVQIKTDTRTPACGGSGKQVTINGPTALGIVSDAAEDNRNLSPLGVSDKFSFGLLVCGIGDFLASDTAFWLYKVNHKEAQVGGDQYKLTPGDEVLWFYQDTKAGTNTGKELELRAPARAKPGKKFTVTVRAYDGKGKATRAEGAKVSVGGESETTDEDGKARIEIPRQGTRTLRATRKGDIASAPVAVCVNRRPSRCPARNT